MTTNIVGARRRRQRFHPLTVAAVQPLTDDSVVVSFSVPPHLREDFEFQPGQHLTVRRVESDGEEVRRSYSLCSTPDELSTHGVARIGVRFIAGGTFSRYAAADLHVGDTIEVLPPLGHFTTALTPTRTRHYLAVAAGSGITPVLCLIAAALGTEPNSHFTVVYGNRQSASVMFVEELADLKDRYPQRLNVVHVLSREAQMSELLSGRIDAARLRSILDSGLVDAASVDEWFLCGPHAMVLDAQVVLAERGVASQVIHTELFHVDSEPPPERTRTEDEGSDPAGATVTIVLDGRESTFTMSRHARVLDAALKVRAELPYACKGGVCSTCRARLVEGEVVMANNYVLEPDELALGYVLTCQSSPVTDRLVVDYDG